jgi:hypothetical protein
MPANQARVFSFRGLQPHRRYAVSFEGVNQSPRRSGIVQTPLETACSVSMVAVYGNSNTIDATLPVFEAEVSSVQRHSRSRIRARARTRVCKRMWLWSEYATLRGTVLQNVNDDVEAGDEGVARWLWDVPEGAKALGPVSATRNVWEQLWDKVQRPWCGLDVAVHLGGQVRCSVLICPCDCGRCFLLCFRCSRCCAVLCCAVLCCAVLCCAVLCCAVLCCAVLCCAVLLV